MDHVTTYVTGMDHVTAYVTGMDHVTTYVTTYITTWITDSHELTWSSHGTHMELTSSHGELT